MKKLLDQIVKFGITGVLAFILDYGLMVLLTEGFQVNYLLSSAISFGVSVIFNYIVSVHWVFQVDTAMNPAKQFSIFFVLSIIGLGINALLMWFGVDFLHIHYMITKIGATAIVMVYNFITRKLFLEQKL